MAILKRSASGTYFAITAYRTGHLVFCRATQFDTTIFSATRTSAPAEAPAPRAGEHRVRSRGAYPARVLAATCGLFGLVVGSFLNVVIHRVPRKESIVRPGSHCPRCDAVLLLSSTCLCSRGSGSVVVAGSAESRFRPGTRRSSCSLPRSSVAAGCGSARRLPSRLPRSLRRARRHCRHRPRASHHPEGHRLPHPRCRGRPPRHRRGVGGRSGPRSCGLPWAGSGVDRLFAIHLIQPRGMGFGDVRLAAVLGFFLGWLGLAHVAPGFFPGVPLRRSRRFGPARHRPSEPPPGPPVRAVPGGRDHRGGAVRPAAPQRYPLLQAGSPVPLRTSGHP